MNALLPFIRFLLVFVASIVCAAETPQLFRSQMWQTEDGLPRNSVAAICQTRDGFLWIGTGGGLTRFDGVEFDVYPVDVSSEKFPSITALCSDADGGLWVGTGGQGLFHLQDGKWTAQTNVPASGFSITCLNKDGAGAVWVGTRTGLWRCEAGELSPFQGSDLLSTNFIRSLFEDAQGRTWISYTEGLACVSKGIVETNYPAKGSFPDPLVRTATIDRRGVLWVGTRNGLNRQGRGVKTFLKTDGLPDNIISALHEDRRGILWVGTLGGLARREGGQFVAETTRDGDAFDQVFCLHEDHEGNVWAGTKEGLFRFSPQHCQTFTRRHGLAHNNVITVLPSSSGIWAGTWGGGLHEIAAEKVVAHFNRARMPEMRNDLILAICERPGGGLWFGTDFGGGLYELKPGKGKSWQCIRYETTTGEALTAVRAITLDARQNLWVGTTTGLYRSQGKSLVASSITPTQTNASVRCFLQGRNGSFWIGTEQGLVCWTATQTNAFTTAHGLSDNRVLSLHEDEQGTLWIGTAQGGLNRLNVPAKVERSAVKSLFTSYTTSDGLHNNTILEILESADGFLWMSSYHGVFSVSKKELMNYREGQSAALRCLSFGQDDGMESPVCVGAGKPAGCIGPDGRLWFPTTKGVVAVNATIPLNDSPPPVVIRRVLADRKVICLQLSGTGTSQTATNRIASITIAPGRGELEIHFSALSFQAPAKNRYKYKLEGVDPDWVESKTQRTASYHNLKPGRYTFRVMACNNHGVWNTDGATLTLEWQPHFRQTWMFKLMIGGMVGLVLFGFDRIRVARVREVERLRLRIAADLHDEVGSNLGSVSMLARLLRKSKTMTAEEQKDVALIEHVTAETANAVKDIVWFTNPAFDTTQDMLMRMKDTAETMLTGKECVFESQVENMNGKLSLEFRKNIFLIFKESLANIVKHSQATRVDIAVSEQNNVFRLSIRDNGIGFDPGSASRGNGLKNLRRRAAEIGGTFDIQTTPGKGTVVILSLPPLKS